MAGLPHTSSRGALAQFAHLNHLCMVAQVCLKAKAVHDGNERLDHVDRRARLWRVFCDMPTALAQHSVDGLQAICRAVYAFAGFL